MTRETFDGIAQEVVLSLRSAEGLGSALLDKLSDVLDEQLPIWRNARHLDKTNAYALVVLRDNIFGAMRQYTDPETLDRIAVAARRVENFMEQALLHHEQTDDGKAGPSPLTQIDGDEA